MRLIKPSFEIIVQGSDFEGLYKHIEICGRTCYKSLDKITEDSAEGFVNRMISSNHLAMLEHGTIYLTVPCDKLYRDGSFMLNEPRPTTSHHFYKRYDYDNFAFITTNYRYIVENKLEHWLEFLTDPSTFHEKRHTVKFILDRSTAQEFTRHRVFSMAMESQRYCNYSKDRFNNEVTFCIPCWTNLPEGPIVSQEFNVWSERLGEQTGILLSSLWNAEIDYFNLLKQGWKPEQARIVLPNATKTELIMTGFTSDWTHFFELRALDKTGKAHPSAKELAVPLCEEFIKRESINGRVL